MRIATYSQSEVEPNSISAPRQGGGSPVAAAVGDIGKSVASVAGDVAEYEAKANAAVVMGKVAQLNQQRVKLMNDPQSGLLTQQGENAINITPKGLEAFDKMYGETLEGMNPKQQMLFRQHTMKERAEVELQLMRHEAEQGKALQIGSAKAVVDTDEQVLSTLYRDPAAFNDKLKQMQAHVLDHLHMKGISASNPIAADEVYKATSKAYVSMIKQTMSENPSQALHIFEVHQDEIEPHERDTLKHSIGVMNDENEGINAAFEMSDHIRTGDKTESEMEAMLHDQFKNKPGAFKHAKTQLNDLIRKDHDDKINDVADYGGKIESAIDEAYASGRVLSDSELHSMPEYQAMVKMGHKEAQGELNKIRSYMAKTKHEIVKERKDEQAQARRDAADARRDRSESERTRKESADQFKIDISDPEKLTSMTDTEIKEKGRAAGLKYKDIKELENQRKKYLKDPETAHSAQIDSNTMSTILSKAGITSTSDVAKYRTLANQYVKTAEKQAGKHFSPAEKEALIIQGLQNVAVNTTRASIAGIEYGKAGETKRRMEVKNPAAIIIPKEADAEITRRLGSRAVKLTPERRQKYYDEILKEKE